LYAVVEIVSSMSVPELFLGNGWTEGHW